MTRFAALGDSITVGMGDPAPGGGWRGWATLLAGTLPQPELHNLATMRAVNAAGAARVAGQRPRGTGTRRRGTGTGEPERLKQAFRKLAASRALALGSAQAAEPTITT